LTLADGWKTAIAEYYANTGGWPLQTELTGTNPSSGKYETSVGVTTRGTITIVYGNQANTKINAAILGLTAYTNANNDVMWQCGFAIAPPSGTVASGGASGGGTTVSPQYLPTSCHS
jgi:type IV pilus assembly protein PilA